jgi:hypothetical protein
MVSFLRSLIWCLIVLRIYSSACSAIVEQSIDLVERIVYWPGVFDAGESRGGIQSDHTGLRHGTPIPISIAGSSVMLSHCTGRAVQTHCPHLV